MKTLLLVIFIGISSVLSASTDKNLEGRMVVHEIKKLLLKPNFEVEKEVLIYVKIILNAHDEMVVLSADTENYQIDNYIKKRLNYVKLKTCVKENLRTFIVPVRLRP